jgi:hypothetical protein
LGKNAPTGAKAFFSAKKKALGKNAPTGAKAFFSAKKKPWEKMRLPAQKPFCFRKLANLRFAGHRKAPAFQ